ncbi:hypothetical protein EKN06_00290 [Croceicoccus ponticola]|uniref:Uncharacterized protein n=1 Tax=Croceicoccus ponticola TaxID=2217664 RepID=A0A437GZF8_9SPHN|nr:hypothetical protein [Croceicoccus ponticola]RVQ68710.1 hypothetical protein EKN06_00290 [Croceicoccus ponticola]
MTVGSNVRDLTGKASSKKCCDGHPDPLQGTANYQYITMTEKEFAEYAAAKRKAMSNQKN